MLMNLPEHFHDGTATCFRSQFEAGQKAHHIVPHRKGNRVWLPGSALHVWSVTPTKKERINPDLLGSLYWYDSKEDKVLAAADLDTELILGYMEEEPLPTAELCPAVYAVEEIEVNGANHQVKVGGEVLTPEKLEILIRREGHPNHRRFFATYKADGVRSWRGQILHWGNRLYNHKKANLYLL